MLIPLPPWWAVPRTRRFTVRSTLRPTVPSTRRPTVPDPVHYNRAHSAAPQTPGPETQYPAHCGFPRDSRRPWNLAACKHFQRVATVPVNILPDSPSLKLPRLIQFGAIWRVKVEQSRVKATRAAFAASRQPPSCIVAQHP